MEPPVIPRTTGPTQGDFTETAQPSRRWQAKTGLGTLVNGVVHGAPIVLASVVGLIAARLLPPPHGLWWFAWVTAVVATSQVTLKVSERLIRRLLPLGSLMQMSLVFPDEAPSRFAMALRTGNVEKLRRTTAEAVEKGLPSDLSAAAETALAMVAQLNRHDRGTRGHSERVRAFSEVLAEELGCDPEFRDRLRWGALLHDMGKLTVPAEILNKPGKPTTEEWAVLSGHPAEGERILAPLADWLGDAVHAAGQHHERWDGKGYPRGLAGDQIALSARIVAVADAFAVMTGARAYKKPLPLAKARQELMKNAGTQFDPAVVRAMLNISIRRINAAAGPLSALANIPFIGSLIAGVPAIPATIGSGAVAIAMTSAGMIAPAISPIEWILPSSQSTPRELAFEAPLNMENLDQIAVTKPGKTRAPALAFDSGDSSTPAASPTAQTSEELTSPTTAEAIFSAVTSLAPRATVLPTAEPTTRNEPNPVSSVAAGPTVVDQPTVVPNSSPTTGSTPSTTSEPRQTTVATTAPSQTKPPSQSKPSSTPTTTISTSETLPQTLPLTLPPITFPPSETTPPIIVITSTTIDPETTKPPPKPTTQPTTTQTPPVTKPPVTKPWEGGPGGTVITE